LIAASFALAVAAPAASASETSQRTADTVQASIARITISWNTYVFDDLTDSWAKVTFQSQCSGFVVDPNGHVVTAGHCLDPDLASASAIERRAKQLFRQNTEFFESKGITLEQLIAYGLQNWRVEGKGDGSEPAPRIEVILPGGENSEDPVTYPGAAVDVDTDNDIALIKIEATGLPSLQLANADDIEIGEEVLAVGFPALRDSVTDPSMRPTFKSGSISDTAATRNEGEVPVYETSAPMGQGMSGGPTVDSDGNVIGVNSYGTNLNNDFNWIAPSHLVRDMLEANGVTSEPGPTDVLFRQALAAFYSADYRTAVAKLDAVLDRRPDHPVALRLVAEAKEGADRQPASQTGFNFPWLSISLAVAFLATLGVSFLIGRSLARSIVPAGMALGVPAGAGAPIPAGPTVVVGATAPIGFQPPRAHASTQMGRRCSGCATTLESTTAFCRSCGSKVG